MEEWFRDYQDSLFVLFDQIPLNDSIAREKLILLLSIVRKFKTSLQQFADEGEMSEKDVKRMLELEKKGFLGGLLGGE